MRRWLPCLSLLVALPAAADPYAERSGGATAYYLRSEASYEVAGVERDFTHRRYALDYSEQANDWLHLGISMGLAFSEAPGEPLLATLEPSGYLFGVFGGAKLFEHGRFTVGVELGYLREVGDSADATDEVTLELSEGRAQLSAAYRFDALRLVAGAYALEVSGEIERSGGTPGTARFEQVEGSGALLGLELPLANQHALGLRVESGARDSVVLSFSTRF